MAFKISLPADGGPERRIRSRPLNDANVRQAGQDAAAHPEFFFNLFDGSQLDRFPHP